MGKATPDDVKEDSDNRLRALNRTLKALRNSSKALAHAADEASLLRETCRIIVEDCGHAMVWIGYAENDAEKSIRPAAYAGFEKGYLETLRLTWADAERGRGPTGLAIRTGELCLCRNMLTDPAFAPWREEALRRGYASSIAFPLRSTQGTTFGALALYSQHPDPFTEDELALLTDLTDDLAFGICALRVRQVKVAAEAENKRSRRERDLMIAFLRLVNLSTNSGELMRQSALFFKKHAGCDAVGIRLKKGADFPYCQSLGFSEEFLKAEHTLCTPCDRDGMPSLACLCGKVIHGHQKPQGLPFTEHGSFWCNDSSTLLQFPFRDSDLIRGRCIREGYSSIGLLPLYEGAERIGLLQLNYRKKNAFTAEALAFWERLTDHLAVAVAKLQSEEELRKTAAKLQDANTALDDSRRAALFLMEEAFEARRQAEGAIASLRQSEELNRQTLQALPAHVAVLNKDGRILGVNEAWEEFARGNASSDSARVTVGANYLEACRRAAAENDVDAAHALAGIEGVLAGKREHYAMEYACHSPQQQRWFLMTVTPLGGSGENGAVISHFNITDRKQAEQQLDATTQRLQALMAAVPVGISFSDDATCQNITGNPAVLAQFEVKPEDNLSASAPTEEAPGRKVHFFISGRLITDAELPLQRAVAENNVIPPMELEVLLPSGRRWFAESSGAPIRNAQGKVVGGIAVTVDITERKRTEETLRANEEQLSLVLRASAMGIFDVSIGTGETRWNEQEFALLGLTPDEAPACPETFFRYVHPEDSAALREKWKEAYACGKLDAEFRIIRADGMTRWLAAKGQLIGEDSASESVPDNRSRDVRFMGVNFDITANRLVIEALRKSELRFRSIFDHAATGFAITDCAGRFAQCNEAYCRLTGYPSSELLKLDFPTLIHPQERERTMALIRQLLEGEIPSFEIENKYVHKGGSLVSVHTYVSALRNTRGQPTHIVTLVTDITERKRTEDVLRFLGQCGSNGTGEGFFPELARYLAQVLNMDYVCIDRLEEGNLSAQTLAVFHNGTFEDTASYALKDTPCGAVVGQRICCFPRNVRGLFAKDVVLQGLQAESYLGTTLWSAKGKPIGLIAIIGRKPLEDTRLAEAVLQLVAVRAAGELERQQAEHAITQLNSELEQRVQARTEELAATNRELESFCYSVSHDLRAPLRSMDGFSQALLDDCGAQLDAAGQDFLHRIRSNCQRMARLIDDLLHLSRLTRAHMRHEPVDLTALAQSAVADLRQGDPERSVDVRIAPGLTATGDPVLLRTALANLLENAWKFSAKRPDAVIEVGQTDLTPPPVLTPLPSNPQTLKSSNASRPQPSALTPPSPVFFVRDNGVGFDMQYADKLFTPFQRLHAMTEFPGSGIGLATVQRVLHRHGGRIWFESAPGQGATFYFTIGAQA